MDASSLGLTEDVASVSAKLADTTGTYNSADMGNNTYLEEGNYTIKTTASSASGTSDGVVELVNSDNEVVASSAAVDTQTAGFNGALALTNDAGETVMTLDGDVTATVAADETQEVAIGSNGADVTTAGTEINGLQVSGTMDEGTGYQINVFDDSGTYKAEVLNSDGDTISTADVAVTAGENSITVTNEDGTTSDITFGAQATPTAAETVTFDVVQSDYESGSSEAAKDSDGDGKIDTDAKVAKGIDVRTQENADKAISVLDEAIAKTSAERSKLGALQNRLDHTINNLNTAEENLTAAESRISDVDMAKEMMNMSKQQILSQAGTAMMAQANQLPQGVLQLLG